MRLLILRHAEAEDNAPSDFERKLTAKGVEQAQRVGEFMKMQGLLPDLVLTSPYLRALQTAQGVTKVLDLGEPTLDSTLGCGMTPLQALNLVKSQAEQFQSILLVGHQPDLGELMSVLLGAVGGGGVHVRKAALAGFWLHSFTTGGGTLEFMIPAKFMKS